MAWISFDPLEKYRELVLITKKHQPSICSSKNGPKPQLEHNLPLFGVPGTKVLSVLILFKSVCRAGVYEYSNDENPGKKRFQINASNCIHCKTCGISKIPAKKHKLDCP
jgi:electron-transferring-flavoprotein dehydrogenase